MTPEDKAFYRGFAVAAASVARAGGHIGPADLMDTNGVTLEQLKQAGVAAFDMRPIIWEFKLCGRLEKKVKP